MREHGGKMPLGMLRTVVPAAPDAWITALSDYGTMSFGDVAGAAIRYAREGFAVFEYMATMIKQYEDGYRVVAVQCRDLPARRPGAAKSATASCRPTSPARCNTWSTRNAPRRKRGRLAGLAAARAAFYCGDIAETIVRYHEQNGGYLARDDLAGFHSRYEAPVSVRWRDFEVFTCGPWCQGPMLAQALRMIEAAGGLKGLAHNSADYIHLVTEILKAACADREYRYGDPLFVDVGLDELLSDAPCRGPGRRDRPAARHARHAAAARAAIPQPRRRPCRHRPSGATPSSSPTPPTAAPSTAGATRCRPRRPTDRGARR